MDENSINEVREKRKFTNSKFNNQNKFKRSSNSNQKYPAGGVAKKKFVQKRWGNKEIQCFRCGGDHVATDCKIDRNIVCRACNVKGHISKVCFKSGNNSDVLVKYLESKSSYDDVATSQVVDICTVEHTHQRDKFFVSLQVNGKLVEFDIDSGAAVSLMFIDQARRYFKSEKIYSTKLRLMSYCKNEISVIGFISVNVCYNNKNFRLNLYLTNIDRTPLFGSEWLRQIGPINYNDNITQDINVI